jgi:hypothetical protein
MLHSVKKIHFQESFFSKLALSLCAAFLLLHFNLPAQRKITELRTKLYYEFESIPFLQEPDSALAYMQNYPRYYQPTVKKREGNVLEEFEVYVNTEHRKRFLSNEPVFVYQKNVKRRIIDSLQSFGSVSSIRRNYHNERLAKNDFQVFRQEFKKHFSRRKRPFIRETNLDGYRQTIYFYCTKKDRLPYLEITFITDKEKRVYSITLYVMR